MRRHSLSDSLIGQLDQMLRSVVPHSAQATRPSPAPTVHSALSITDSRRSAGLMRVNHSGEVCAQALYHGQALTAKQSHVRVNMAQAAREEIDHLVWCEQRLDALGSHTSVLNPLWYGMSFALGAVAGVLGDGYSLGFVAETERQVSEHLETHLQNLPENDEQSRAIITQMNQDEQQHREQALAAGAVTLPASVQSAMRVVSKVMTTLSYSI